MQQAGALQYGSLKIKDILTMILMEFVALVSSASSMVIKYPALSNFLMNVGLLVAINSGVMGIVAVVI